MKTECAEHDSPFRSLCAQVCSSRNVLPSHQDAGRRRGGQAVNEIDKVSSYTGTHNIGGHPSGLAHTAQVNLRQPESAGNTCLTYTNHNPPTQLEPAYLTLEHRTPLAFRRSAEPLASPALFPWYLFHALQNLLLPKIPLLVGHCVPPIHRLSPLG